MTPKMKEMTPKSSKIGAKETGSGNRDSRSVSWAGTWLLGSGYSGESTVLSGSGSSRKSSGGAG
eukprot:scaffold33119_cov36-Cyclotella_meneghiniana.AAC.2